MSNPLDSLHDLAEVATHVGEVVLLGYGESSATGPYLRLLLPDPDDLAPFRGKTTHSKNKSGTRYTMVLVELQDDETPAAQPQKADTYSPKAAAMSSCRQHLFQKFCRWRGLREGWSVDETEAGAAHLIKLWCGIESRLDLDHNMEAQRRLAHLMHEYREWSDALPVER